MDDYFFEDNSAHYQSKSGSLYFFTKEGVYRYSNHWGRVANCRWKISGIEDYKNQNKYVGYASWEAFFPLNNIEKSFYIDVDYSKGNATVVRNIDIENSNYFLMTSDFAHKRLKEIKALFKDYKWATYYDEDVDYVRTVFINKLINSNKPLQELKQSLRDDF